MPMKTECSIDKLKSLEGQKLNMTFIDGCSLDLKIISTAHIDDGDDFIAEILRVNCDNKEHSHQIVGTTINIQRADIINIRKL
jgi:hypothetical protein